MKNDKPSIGFIGAGRVGFTLGRYFSENGLNLRGFYSRNRSNSLEAAKFTNSVCYNICEDLIKECDIIFITVSDGAIKEVAENIDVCVKNKIFCHCSGAMSSAVFSKLEDAGAFGYSVHPIFAINDKQNSYKEISKAFFTIEGNKKHIDDVKIIFERLGNRIQIIEADKKIKYHSAAVMASNLVIGLYMSAVDTLVQCGFDKANAIEALIPLFMNNAINVQKYGPKDALTGPVDRLDVETVSKHIEVLDDDVLEVYKKLSKKLVEIVREKGLYENEKIKEMEDILNGKDMR